MATLRAQISGDSEAAKPTAVEVEPAKPAAEPNLTPTEDVPPKRGFGLFAFGIVAAVFWAGAASAYLWGYLGPEGIAGLEPQVLAIVATITLMPPFLFVALAFALARAQAMGEAARRLAAVSERLTAADENAVQSAHRLGRAVRRELDALSAGLDTAFGRLRALETALQDRVAQLEDASARAGVRAEGIAQRLREEREGIEGLASRLDEASSRAAELLAGKTAQLKSMLEDTEGELKSAGHTLEVQAAQFREAAELAASAPQEAAVELDRQAKQIESAADAAVARAEFVLARQERQRVAMNELLARLKVEADAFDEVLERQRNAAENSAAVLSQQALKLDELADQGFRRIDTAIREAAARSAEIADGFDKGSARMNESAKAAESAMERLIESLRQTAASALDHVLEAQKMGSENLATLLAAEIGRLEELTDRGMRGVETAMRNAVQRSAEIVSGFGNETDRVNEAARTAEAAMGRLIENLRQSAAGAVEQVVEAQRRGTTNLAATLAAETKRLEELTGEGLRGIETVMANAAQRSSEIALGFGKESERLTENVQAAEVALARLTESLRQAAESALDHVLDAQKKGTTNLASALAEDIKRLEQLTAQGMRGIEAAMANAARNSAEIAEGFGKDSEHVKETAERAMTAVGKLVENLRAGAADAQTAVANSTEDAKRRAREFVGEAMNECDQLVRAAAKISEEAEKASAVLASAVELAERHIVAIPGVAAQEAERVREALRNETEQMLDISARTLATLQARANRRQPPAEAPAAADASPQESAGEGLRGLARRITGPRRRAEDRTRGNYELSQVLAAAEARDPKMGLKGGAAAALAALQTELADLASELDELAGETADPTLWRRYLDGDRGVFVRRLAASIGPDSVNRITALYRDNSRFHESADAYLEEFEGMLARAREGDRDGFLASTLLTADTGKIYLAIAYALGRLE